MIILKSPEEIKQMRPAAELVVRAHQLVQSMIEPGVSTLQLDNAVEQLLLEEQAEPLFKGVPGIVPFPAVTCISVNSEVVHGIPHDTPLEEGDIVSVDIGCRLHEWCGDAAWTYPVGEINSEDALLLRTGEEVLSLAILKLADCRIWSEVAHYMETHAHKAGYSIVQDFVGHGIGREMHEDPQVPNYVDSEHDFELHNGLVIAIEPMLNAGTADVVLLDDHWTIETADEQNSVHFEHTIALTAEGPIVLTAGIGMRTGH